MTFVEAVVLGLVQGLTEFLPVSSSGHLVLAQRIMGMAQPGVLLEVAVHLATAASVMAYYRKDLVEMLRDVFQGGPGRGLALRIVVASVPAVVAFVLMKEVFETALESAFVAAICLCVTGVVLLATRFARPFQN